MITDAEERKFNIVLCKTQSRFSRDMEIIERYIHDKFLEWKIRFLGVIDHADTEIEGNKKARQINGLVNEWYLEDSSYNIRRTLNHKKEKGEWVGSFAPYGYTEDPNDRNHLVVDPVASEVVKSVFNMYVSGLGYIIIAKKLNEQGIPNPSTYKKINGSNFKTNTTKVTSQVWTDSTIYQMIRRQVYIGNLVQGITENISYKNQKRRKRDPEAWYVKENAHEAIIDMGTWKKVQEKLKSKRRGEKWTGEVHILSGKVLCQECNNTMWKMSYELTRGRYQYLKCKTTKSSDDICANKYSIRLDDLMEKVKEEINNLLHEYYNPNLIKIDDINQNNHKLSVLSIEKETINKQIEKKEKHLEKLYTDRLDEFIHEEQFLKFNKSFNEEIVLYKSRIEKINQEISSFQENPDKQIDKESILKKYSHIDHLSRDIVDEFIDMIYIGAKINDEREIEIKWKF
jgi:DNA invertase Pin-like site-specific DNA recombinase